MALAKEDEPQLFPEIVEAPRYSCAMGGAYAAALATFGSVPILHSGGGCGFAQNFGQSFASGLNSPGPVGGASTPCSTLVEEHVIFGGEDKLRKLIDSTIKLMPGDLYTVISACVPALIGDDVDAVISEFRDRAPLIHVKTSGFAGNSYKGYELYFDAVIDQLLKEQPVKKKTVNILGVVPTQNIFWKGDLRNLKQLLEKVGIEANIIFGDLNGLEALNRIPAAELNLVFSLWGINPAKKLAERFGTPYHIFPSLPIGPKDTTKFLQVLGDKFKISPDVIDRVVNGEERDAYRFTEYVGNILVVAIPHAYYAVVADSSTAIAVTKYATNELGFNPEIVIVTDDPPQEYREGIIRDLTEDLESVLKPKVVFEIDSHKIRLLLRNYTVQIVFASSMERYIAEKELGGALFLSVGFPAYDRLIVDRSYVGYRGGLNLMEDLMVKYGGPL
ncbi:MAG TPA: nitrogenase component 1 [Methylomusa anaerophila]|uniref:Nitrogenase molybdenum-iron protein beta chain n=1 Tax=Methylomusa anaerophila TaxID=1930071 RepID=A0A348AEZ0_9FIRM|nr:nitrogenase component 1 [Methylomusa anaerophila]BBB89638.1 nitrogenase molybdenum-iron protein beta chain [Methylomusa anaerophila]HML89586.1 nitrogenase component 1 [Methylomusa anaerophila]